MSKQPRLSASAALLVAALMLAEGAAAEVAVEALGPRTLSLAPLVDYDSAVLRVAGPPDYLVFERFGPGEAIAVDLVADRRLVDASPIADSGPVLAPELPDELTDGRYRYELRLLSKQGNLQHTGLFFVEGGLTVTREAMRAGLSRARAELAEAFLAANLGEGPATEATVTDFFFIEDSDEDDRALLRLRNEGATACCDDWIIAHYFGDLFFKFPAAGSYRMAITEDGDVGIGNLTPANGLVILGHADLALVETGADDADIFFDGEIADWNIDAGDDLTFNLLDPLSINVLVLEDDAAGTGSGVGVGIFAVNPEASLHVKSPNDGTARLLVSEESATAAPRELFRLRNNGVPQFRFQDTSSGVTWSFAQQVGGFVANRLGTGGNELFIQGNGRVLMGPGGSGVFDLAPTGNLTIAGTLTQGSSRAVKQEIVPVDPKSTLSRVGDLPLSMWRYRRDSRGGRHVGPMAEDFYAAFGLGGDPEHIAPGDTAGVALASIQGLIARLREEAQALRDELAEFTSAQGAN